MYTERHYTHTVDSRLLAYLQRNARVRWYYIGPSGASAVRERPVPAFKLSQILILLCAVSVCAWRGDRYIAQFLLLVLCSSNINQTHLEKLRVTGWVWIGGTLWKLPRLALQSFQLVSLYVLTITIFYNSYARKKIKFVKEYYEVHAL